MTITTSEAPAYWARRVRVFEEWTCPKCDQTHLEERENTQFKIREVECPECGFKKSC